MATYNSFKRINSDALIDQTISSNDIAATTVETANIANDAVTSAKLSNAVNSDKLAGTLDLSGKTVTYRSIVDSDISGSAGITGAKLASGSIITNLGFTPVNTAGDTMTGNLTVAGGNAGANSIARSGDDNTGLNLATNEIRLVTNGLTNTLIDSNGRVRRPEHPSFAVSATNGWLYANSYGGTGTFEMGSVMGWNNASYQTGGNNWNPSNGRYTAPVSGYYMFGAMWYYLNDNNSTPSYVHSWIARNGSVAWMTGGRNPYNINMHGNRNNYDDGSNYCSVFYLNAGEYASCWIRWHNYNSRHHAGHHIFSGHLVG